MALTGSSKRWGAKWAVGLTLLLVAYTLLQPQLNRRLGWNLPALADLQPAPPAAAPQTPESQSRKSQSPESQSRESQSRESQSRQAERPADSAHGQSSGELRYGLLRQTAPNAFVSPEGLRYLPGSQEGHRLKHIERHLVDDPTRPGKHGVFDGDMPQVLRWLDEAYVAGRRGGSRASVHKEDRRTVYEVRFDKPVGYVGGRDGSRQNHPDAWHIRLVLDGDKVITAFPF